jgi:hypothetical protein
MSSNIFLFVTVGDPNALAMRSLKGQSVLREEMAMNVETLQMTRPKQEESTLKSELR